MDNRTISAFMAAQRIIDTLEKGGFYTYDPRHIEDNSYCLPDNLHCDFGASRVVIWDENYDYVIKIARTEDDERYNKREVEIYEAAVAEGLEESFGWCACYHEPSEWDGEYVPGIYVMEFLDGDEECVCERAFSCSFEKYCEIHSIDNPTVETVSSYESEVNPDEEVMNLIKATIPESKHSLFDKFVRIQDITDVHSGNVLFRNDTVVICDYAGWC